MVNNNPLTPCTGNYKVSNGNPGYDFTLPSSQISPIQLCPTDSCQTLTFTWTGNLQGKWGSGNSHASLQFCRHAGTIPDTIGPCFYYVLPAEYNVVDTPGGLSSTNPTNDTCSNGCTNNPIVAISTHGVANGDVNYFGTPNIQGQVYTYSINSLQFHRALDAIGWGYTASEYYLRNYHINNEVTHCDHVNCISGALGPINGAIFTINSNVTLTIN